MAYTAKSLEISIKQELKNGKTGEDERREAMKKLEELGEGETLLNTNKSIVGRENIFIQDGVKWQRCRFE